MIVLILERVSRSLRGELSRWMLEPRSSVFVGTVPATVREKLWEKVVDQVKGNEAATMIHSTDNEQGFAIRIFGDASRSVVDFDGLQLMCMPQDTDTKSSQPRDVQ